MKQCTQLTKVSDVHLEKRGLSQRIIAENIDAYRPTISRELQCITWQRGYQPKQAQMKIVQRHSLKPKHSRLRSAQITYI